MCAASDSSARLLVSRPPITSATRKPAVSPNAHHSGRSWAMAPVPWSCPPPTSGLLASIADGDGALDMAHVQPAGLGATGAADALKDLQRLGQINVLAEHLHLHLADDLAAELDRELLL